MGPKALTFIHSVARKSLTKGQGSGITKIPSAMQAEAKASEIASRLVDAGLDFNKMDDFIRSEADVVKYLNILDSYKANQLKNTRAIAADSPEGKKITEALFGKRGEVVDMKGNVIPEGSGIMGGESIESLMKSGDVTKGTVTKKSKKVTDRDMFRAANERFKVKEKPIDPTFDENMPFDNAAEKIAEIRMSNQNYITDTISKIKSMEPIDAMKEANKVIKREGPYKNLNQQQAKKILEDTENHIFQRNVTPKETDVPMEETADEVTKAYIDAVRKGKFKGTEDQFRDMIDKMMDEDFASGGRVGLRYGGDTMGGKNDKSKSSPGPDRSHVSDRQERSHQRAVAEAQMVNKINEAQAKESPIKTFFDHANFTKGLKRVGSIPNYHQLGGYDFMSRFSKVPPMIAKGLGYGYQGLTEFGKSLTNPNYSLREAYDRAKEEGRLNALGVDAYGDPTNPITQQYANLPMELQPNFESGGRVGLRYGGDTMGGINDKSVSSPGPDRSKVSAQQERSHQEAISRARDSQQYDYTVPKQIVKDIAINTGKNLAGQKIASTLGIGTTPIGILMALKGLYDQTRNPVYSEEDLTYGVPYQTGGRVGLAGGMTRRAFLKLMGGAAATIGAAKSGIISSGKKGATKKVVKEVIKTPNAPGKPEWFDALVNKVILEGDDVTKKLAIKDRQTVHTKKIDNDSEVTVYRDLDDNSVRVEYNSPDVMLDEPVSLTVKPGQADETIKKAPPAEFETYEQGFVARSNGPDDYSIDPEPMIGNSIKDLETDVTKLKEFATGEKQTLKEFVQSKKRKDKVKKINQGDIGETSDYVTKRQGDYYPEYDDYASGGIAGMLGE